jgi:hydroxymethylpyrimidine pyrophosphatase-like HAD family hydrolase
MIVHALAVDYDGTIAEHGRLAPETAAALKRVRESGRRLLLVTGRLLPDLRQVCPQVDELFDAVVAENGAVLYMPATREVRTLGDAPEPVLVEALRRREIPFELGSSLVATTEPYAEACLAAIRDAGVERSLVFNKGALMLLPGGVTKGTGVEAALAAMELSAHNLLGIGDAENDHAFLGMCECAVAVADAVPALRERADYVTRGRAGAGVIEFIEEHLLNDAARLVPGLARHHLELGRTPAGEPAAIPAHATGLLIVGPSATGKSTLTGVIVERLVRARRTFCLLDPEGDHETLAELEGVVTLGGKGRQTLPDFEELQSLLRGPSGGLVLNLSALSMADKVRYATRALAAIAAVRSASGLPHWLLVDEAHHLAPAEGSSAAELLDVTGESLVLITLSAEHLAREARRGITAVASTDHGAFRSALETLGADGRPFRPWTGDDGRPLERGEALLARLGDGATATLRFQVATREVHHRRHVRKYAEGELPPDRSFFFRGPAGALNLRAANLKRFCELAEGVDDGTWMWHLRRRDYSAWVRRDIKDAELADEIAAVEHDGAEAAASRRRVLEAVRRRYAV